MKFHKQRFRHKPELGQFGDCHRTAIACILDLEPEEVPNFGEAYEDGARFQAWVKGWLLSKGFACASLPVDGAAGIDGALRVMTNINSDILFIFAGTSRTGCNHSVIALNGAIIHDPSLDDAGIVGPCNDGNFWIDLFVPAIATIAEKTGPLA